jgi:hypothetical protein
MGKAKMTMKEFEKSDADKKVDRKELAKINKGSGKPKAKPGKARG